MKRIQTASVAAVLALLLAVPAALAGDTGTIEGTLEVRKSRELPNVVVYLKDVPGDYAPPAEEVMMDQENLTFVPHVLPVLKGTKVGFRNSDSILHNVFSPDAMADKFNLGTWPKGEVRSHLFDKDGVGVILCNVHPEMEAWVVVLDNPYFTKPDEDGAFRIEGVPPGKYTLTTWHEKLRSAEAEVEVKAGETVRVDLSMKRRKKR